MIRNIPARVSFIVLMIALALAQPAHALAFSLTGVTPTAVPEQVITFDADVQINDLKIVTDEQFEKTLPLSAFYKLPVEKDEFKGVSTKFSAGHPGVDFRATLKSNVHAIQKGTVLYVGAERGGYGNYVLIEHESGIQTLYAHMGKVTVEVGDKIYTGQKIGVIGMTGHTSGPHLHFEMRTNNGFVNPEKIFEELKYTPALRIAMK